ncbi:MAG: hypothetical protein TECD_01042 [Hyphomicrobiaceae bacterium hypho_1]
MISIVIPTLNASDGLALTLSSLISGLLSGIIREVIIVDGGSSDQTLEIAEAAGAKIIQSKCGRGTQLRSGANAAQKSEWLLFLHADTILETGWDREVHLFIEEIKKEKLIDKAAAFRFALDDTGFMPRLIELGVALRCSLFRMPYGDQGLLISHKLYNRVGGFSNMALLEDVDLIRRIGRSRVFILKTCAITSATRYKSEGYVRRVLRNWFCLLLYYCRIPVEYIVWIYG